ncbi:MAG: ATP-binding protein [Candidatus Saccharibacteria bacterium]
MFTLIKHTGNRLGIRTKILLLIMAATILPLLSLNIFWTNSQRQSLVSGVRSSQALVTENNAAEVNNFITQKVRTLIIHSQSPSLQQFNLPKASLEMGTLLYQDKDISRAALVNQSGQEVVALTSDLKNSPLHDVKSGDPFKVVTYYAGNDYISPVSTDVNGHPSITIAVPLVTFTTPQELGTLSTAEPGLVRNPQDIKGALIVQVSLENLWNSVLSSTNSKDGYAYVIDDKGTVIAHPDSSFINSHKDLSATPIVALFKQSLGNTSTTPQSLRALSEKGVQVMATYQKISVTDWGVVYEQPIASIYKSANRVLYFGIALSAGASILMALLSLWLSRFITKPILQIAQAAERIGKGDFTEQVVLNRSDEIGALGQSVNTMGANLQAFISRIESQRKQLEVILNSTTDSILAIDQTGIITIANNATTDFTGRNNSPIGENINALFSWTQNQRPYKVDYAQPGTTTHYDLQYTSPSGMVHFVNLIVVQAAGQTIITIHDETKSRDLDDMKLDFVSMAAHELRTPLSTIRGYLELISYQRDQDPEKIQHYIKQARRSAEELASLISNLLDVSRIERGTLVLTMHKLDLAESLKQSVQNLHFNAETKHTSIAYTGPDQGQFVIADGVALREVIDNLIDNAIKYTPENGAVRVDLQESNDSYIVKVTDNGIGIPANALPYLFSKFYRVHGGLESGSTGTGLGLFISKSIIERHGGTITVESKHGEGSTFIVTIPKFSEQKFTELRESKGAENVSRKRGWTTKNIAR